MELLERALSGENIADAVEAVVKNKGACGIDGITTEKFKEDFYNGKINFEEIKDFYDAIKKASDYVCQRDHDHSAVAEAIYHFVGEE